MINLVFTEGYTRKGKRRNTCNVFIGGNLNAHKLGCVKTSKAHAETLQHKATQTRWQETARLA